MSLAALSAARILSFAALCGAIPSGVGAGHCGQGLPHAATVTDPSFTAPLTTENLFSRLHERHDWQESHLAAFSVLRTYTVHKANDVAVAQEVVAMKYSPPGTKTFAVVSATGSKFVLTQVFKRLMAREAARTRTQNDSDDLITPENYTFEITGQDQVGSNECIVVHALPKHKKTNLFEGNIWIDIQDFAIVKIKGHLAKSPSFWVKRIEFERQYEKVGAFFVLRRETAAADVRIYGRRTLTVDCEGYAFDDNQVAKRPAIGIGRRAYSTPMRNLPAGLSDGVAERPSCRRIEPVTLTSYRSLSKDRSEAFGLSDRRKPNARAIC